MEDIDRLCALVASANGMMPLDVYKYLYSIAKDCDSGKFFEIGTAHGAATIALGLGATISKNNVIIDTIDTLGGKYSSRSIYGDVDKNRNIALHNFKVAGLSEVINLFVGTSEEFFNEYQEQMKIYDIVMLDADGQIDRDISLLLGNIKLGSFLVVDDIDPFIFVGKTNDDIYYIDLKHKISSMLIDAYIDKNWIQIDKIIHNTGFFRFGPETINADDLKSVSLDCYRKLIFTDIKGKQWEKFLPLFERREEAIAMLQLSDSLPKLCKKTFCLARKFWKR